VASAASFAGHVDPFAGTVDGPHSFGRGNTFPGATVPFRMVQWSPDATTARVTSPAIAIRVAGV